MDEYYINLLIEFALSMKWMYIVIVFIAYHLISRAIDLGFQAIDLGNRYINIKDDQLILQYNYKEEDILAHLDLLINESLDQYQLLKLVPQGIDYIDSKIQEDIRNTITDEIDQKIPTILLRKLMLLYSGSSIGDIIGKHIYMAVLQFTIEYNSPKDTK